MTLEDRVKATLGDLLLQNLSLATQLADAQKRIAELEKATSPAPAQTE